MSDLSYSDLYPSRFVTAGDLGDRKVTVTIADVRLEVLAGEKGEEQKPVIAFEGRRKTLVLPKLNAQSLVAMFGKNVRDWIGKRIVLWATDTVMPMPAKNGKPDPCIRIWGSPDISANIPMAWLPPRRKREVKWTLYATGKAAQEPEHTEPFIPQEVEP